MKALVDVDLIDKISHEEERSLCKKFYFIYLQTK